MMLSWTYLQGNWVLCPPNPCAIIHFLGGAFVATAPQVTYAQFLTTLAQRGYCVIAAPFLVQPNHQAIATEVTTSFQATYTQLLRNRSISSELPIFGLGHSLGCKLHLLITCAGNLARAGNILISFNNASSDRAIPFAEVLNTFMPLTFSPSPEDTLKQIQTQYQQAETLVIRFKTDTLDESHQLIPILRQKFPTTLMNQILAGDHLTPLGQTLTSENTKNQTINAFGQWVNDEVFAQRSRLEQITVKWLDYQQQRYRRSQ